MKYKFAKRFLATFLFFCVLSSTVTYVPTNPNNSISSFAIFGPVIDCE